ncbi:NADH-ubiquinone oxidoreductase B18 subunit (NDUFB7), putative [Leishmania lindenbergi]|uniref:NADH-ubiquinone oxidoreductase B18 subunit (NDUFB7) n=1 Tax=Leishmania lindenbergi TaxID=651832 RepID=A0AAW3AVQ9_9TRYP
MGAKGSKTSSSSSAVLAATTTAGEKQDTAKRWDGAVGNVSDADLGVTPDVSLYSDISTPEENAAKRKAYAHLKSPYAKRRPGASAKVERGGVGDSSAATSFTPHMNLIEQIYNEDFDTIDHIQALRLPPVVARQLKSTVRDEAGRRCAEVEKRMARCLQDKMWTSWKCQKERDTYYRCVEDTEQRNLRPDPVNPDWVDMLTSFRWKYNLGVFHGEIIGRNNIMREIWREHYPDRELPHPWVKDT